LQNDSATTVTSSSVPVHIYHCSTRTCRPTRRRSRRGTSAQSSASCTWAACSQSHGPCHIIIDYPMFPMTIDGLGVQRGAPDRLLSVLNVNLLCIKTRHLPDLARWLEAPSSGARTSTVQLAKIDQWVKAWRLARDQACTYLAASVCLFAYPGSGASDDSW